MATNNVNLGIGQATGMAYFAPKGTALPTTPADIPDTPWAEIGAISEDGISFSPNRDLDTLENWGDEIERLLTAEGDATVEAPFLYTDEDTLKILFGDDVVSVIDATQTSGGIISVDIDIEAMPEDRAFLFLMKDGDDTLMLGTDAGFITSVSDISFAPSDAITWTATISASKWTFAKDDGDIDWDIGGFGW